MAGRDKENPSSFKESLSAIPKADTKTLAWDTAGVPERGSSNQPWRNHWPPKDVDKLPEEELKAKPWLTWKRDSSQPNDKPWYAWVNSFEGEVDQPCLLQRDGECPYCKNQGCKLCSTVAEGG